MTTVQERLQMSSMPLDKWSTKEQLCLASAVSSSGEQNWISVSRTIKMLCDNGSRPADWYSQKSCAMQFGQLLESVEIPKRKNRDSGTDSPVETPTDLILRRLTDQRMLELKAEIRKEQEEYGQIFSEIKALQSGQLTNEQLLEMWRDIEKQQEALRIEEMKLENQMREREQRKQEMQRNWRVSGAAILPQKPASDTTVISMDVEEIIGTGKAVLPSGGVAISSSQQQKQQQQPQQPKSTSPLLSSLLKSPTSTAPPANNVTLSSSANSARATAPTITTLLTSGSIPNSNQPAITLKSTISPNEAQLLTRPISGPPDSASNTTVTQSLLSPSQSAPTLSMLLEKNKVASAANQAQNVAASSGDVPARLKLTDRADSNNEEVPMDIEEDLLASVTEPNSGELTAADSPDANETQQLLEVFKNIGEMDEVDLDVAAVIDEEVDFLKGVDDEPVSTDVADIEDIETKLESGAGASSSVTNEIKANIANNAGNELKFSLNDELKEAKAASNAANDNSGENKMSKSDASIAKVETISSDDSNDNIPLAAVASLESKERSVEPTQEQHFLKEKVESALKNEDPKASPVPNDAEEASKVDAGAAANSVDLSTNNEAKNLNIEQKSPTESDSSDVIVIPTDDDDESNGTVNKAQEANAVQNTAEQVSQMEQKAEAKSAEEKDENERHATDLITETKSATVSGEAAAGGSTTTPVQKSTPALDNEPIHAVISIADTDEDSSTTDVSITTRKDDKISKLSTPTPQQQQQLRKIVADNARNEQKTEEETTTQATTTATPARPPMLRKLRDRDGSESPMIDDETTTTSDHSTTTITNTTNQRSRRRYSSTPIIDSIPNSPASSERDDRETRASKKSLLSIYNALQPSKYAALFQRAFNDEHTKYDEVCLRPIDFPMIKRHIDSGAIRSVNELQRDIMLMCQNALMIFKTSSANYKAVHTFMHECQTIREFVTNPNASVEVTSKTERESKESRASLNASISSSRDSGVKVRGSARKSQRIS